MPVVNLNWETVHLHGEAWISHHRLRHRLFVERQGWDVRTFKGLEHDEFDTPSAQYIVWVDESGEARGVVRLLPTTRPYMLQQLWPELISGQLPQSDSVWEATRFGCDRSLDPTTRREAVVDILSAMQEFGIAGHIERYLAVMPLRLLRAVVIKAGCEVELLSAPRLIGRFRTVAACLTVSPRVLARLRRGGQ